MLERLAEDYGIVEINKHAFPFNAGEDEVRSALIGSKLIANF